MNDNDVQRITKLRQYKPAATTSAVAIEMFNRGFVAVLPAMQFGTTPRRAAQALRALGYPARERHTRDNTHAGPIDAVTVWTTPAGASMLTTIDKARTRMTNVTRMPRNDALRTLWSERATKRAFALGRVASYFGRHKTKLGEFYAAYHLDASDSTICALLEPVRRALLEAS
jgi:hypothetical protein